MTVWSKRPVRMAAGAAIVLGVAGILAFELFGSPTFQQAARDVAATTSPSPAVAVLGATSTPGPSEPSPTPFGTPAPIPSTASETSDSAKVSPPPTPVEATPTPSPQPGLWRIQGYVVDENGNPLANVCVVVGPHGCQRYSPHTDQLGHYFLDVAAAKPGGPTTPFDFYFEMPGRETVWWHFVPGGPIEFNVVLHPS